MYKRDFNKPPVSIIHNGKALFGTYKNVSQKLDIRGIHAPYAGIPLPSFISNLRIKSCLDYIFDLENYIGFVEFFDFKVFGFAIFVLWNKQNLKKYSYYTFMPTRKRFIPTVTSKGRCVSYNKKRYIKVSWGRNHEHMALKFNFKGDSIRPAIKGGTFSSRNSTIHTDNLFVNPSPTSSRVSATWFTSMDIQGQVSINDNSEESTTGLAAMSLNRTYYKTHTKNSKAWGIGTLKNKKIIFELQNSNLDAADNDTYNNNILVVDGKTTFLPSVLMTHSFGINKDWIIQDTENMVDLTFTPGSLNSRILNVIAMRTNYTTIYGVYNGVLMDQDGNKIVLKNFPGIIHRNILRITL